MVFGPCGNLYVCNLILIICLCILANEISFCVCAYILENKFSRVSDECTRKQLIKLL